MDIDFTKMNDAELEDNVKRVLPSMEGSFTYLAEYLRRDLKNKIITCSLEDTEKLKHQYAFISELEYQFKNISGE